MAEYAGGSVEGFANLMNEKARNLNLKNTHFQTPHGLDSEEHYTTAYELALLSNYALKNKTFSQIVGTKNYTVTINGNSKEISNTNELLGALDGVYGVKTGFTNGANRCLVTACKRSNMDIICVVLGADTKKFRTQDSIKLINYVFNSFQIVNLEEMVIKEFESWKEKNANEIVFNKGNPSKPDLVLDILEYTSIPIRKDLIDNLSISIDYKTVFDAPMPSNYEITAVQIKLDDDIILNVPIINKNQIKKKSVFFYLDYFFKNIPNIIQEQL